MILVARLVAFAVLLQSLEMLYVRRGMLAVVTLLAALAALTYPHPAPLAFMLVGTWGLAWCFRGTFNGGSDSMTVLLLLACLIVTVAPEKEVAMRTFVTWLVAGTYLVAGLAKLANADWRSGRALRAILEDSPFAYVRRLPVGWRLGAWAVIAFEGTFPLVFLGGPVTLAYLAAGVVFHALNFYYFGLNRFFWIWLAAYPAFGHLV